MAVNQFRKGQVRGLPEQQALERARYAEELLSRYRGYVETTLQPELEELRGEAADLRASLRECTDERDAAREASDRLRGEVADAVSLLQRAQATAREDQRAAAQRADDLVAAVRAETETRIALLTSERDSVRQQLATANARGGVDDDTARQLGSLKATVQERGAALDSARRRVQELEEALAAAERASHAGSAGAVSSSIASALLEAQATAREASDFSASVAAAFAQIDVDVPSIHAAQRGWQAVAAATAAAAPADDTVASAASLRDLAGEVSAAAVALRRAASQEHTALAGGIRALVVAHTQSLEAAATGDASRQQERELQRQRLAELEKDRRAEREALMAAVERERLHALLANPSGADPAELARLSASGAAAGAGGINASAATRDGVSPPRHRRSVGAQTGPELAGTAGEANHSARLLAEVHGLQQQLTQHRETISLMERQRRKFMAFADDVAVASKVHRALRGSDVSAEAFMLHGVK